MKRMIVFLLSLVLVSSCVKFPPPTPKITTYDVEIIIVGDGTVTPKSFKNVPANQLCSILITPGVGSILVLVTVNGIDIKAPKVSYPTTCNFYVKSHIKMVVVFEKEQQASSVRSQLKKAAFLTKKAAFYFVSQLAPKRNTQNWTAIIDI